MTNNQSSNSEEEVVITLEPAPDLPFEAFSTLLGQVVQVPKTAIEEVHKNH